MLEPEEQTVGGEELSELKVTMDLSADVLEVNLPPGMVSTGQTIKNELLVRSEEGNQSATEFCWLAN